LALEKLPERYVNTFTTLSMGGNINLDMFGEMVEAIYQANQSKAKSNDDEEDEEINLATFDNSKKKNKKPKWKKKGYNNNDKEKCKHCGRKGHQPDKCWMLDKNKSKQPEWFDPEKYCCKKEKEVSNAAVSHSRGGLELLLMAMSFPKALDILDDPNVWIVNTGASCNSTPHSKGAVNMRKGNGGVIFSNGKNNDANEIFDLPGVIMDQNRNEKLPATFQNVKHVRLAKFNLFSLTKRQKAGWLLNGDSEKIWITKGEHKIVFDIQIETPEGLIFAMYHKQKETEVNAAGPAGPEQATKKLTIKKAHVLLGHMNKDMCQATCKVLGWELNRGTFGVCAACMVAKAKQKNITTSKEDMKELDGKT
jgi:hypothetical protein